MDYRQFLEMHNNCTKALADDKAKMPSQNIVVDTGLYGLYTKFQAAYPARLAHLRSGNFQESVEPGRDKCVCRLCFKNSPQKLEQEEINLLAIIRRLVHAHSV